MYKIKSIDIGNNTYCFGCATKYELTEQQKEHRRYMIKQKALGILATVSSIVMLCCGAAPALFLTIIGIAVTLTDKPVIG